MTTDDFAPKVVERAVELQAHCESMRAAAELANAMREHSEQAFREALHEMATVYPALLSDDAVGPWLGLLLVKELSWTPEEVQELERLTANLGAA